MGFLCFLSNEAKAHPLLDRAISAYEMADFENALQIFDAAEKNADLSVEELLQLFEMRALVHHAIGDKGAMQADLRRLAAVRPDYAFSQLAPPPVRQAFHDMLETSGGSLGVELVIEETGSSAAPVIVARVDQVPEGLVDHTGLKCRVGSDNRMIARTAKGTRVKLELPDRGGHNGCEATANTRLGGTLFTARIDGAGPSTTPSVFRMPEYKTRADQPAAKKKKKKWPWIVAATAVVVAGGVTAGVVLSQRSNETSATGGAVTVNW